MTTVPTVETDVLIVGSGPAGASAALALSTDGLPNVMVTRYSHAPGAHDQPAHHGSAA
jgi:2,4-dichlorophenol 6-monooxygenase